MLGSILMVLDNKSDDTSKLSIKITGLVKNYQNINNLKKNIKYN
jgi:hypothetical protein